MNTSHPFEKIQFEKILVANRGGRAGGAGERSHLREAHVSGSPNCRTSEARGDEAAHHHV
jgi:hypothetical protein